MPLDDALYERFRSLIIQLSGLDFAANKRDMLRDKLEQRARASGCPDLDSYYTLLHTTPGEQREAEQRHLFALLTINETCFFRNQEHFATLREVALPELIASRRGATIGGRKLKVWSAGCSTGEEAYSLAIALREGLLALPNGTGWHAEVYATDIDEPALLHAQRGYYNRRAVREVVSDIRARYFTTEPPDADEPSTFIISRELQKEVRFDFFNLAHFPYDLHKLGNQDIIFCENVMIYFAPPVMRQVIDNLYRCLRPGGYLFLGYAETLWHIPNRFQLISLPNTFCYRRPLNEESAIPTAIKPAAAIKPALPVEAPPAPRRRQSGPLTMPSSQPRMRGTGPLAPMRAEPEQLSPAQWCATGYAKLDIGLYDEAAAAFQNALRENPQQVEAIVGLARIHANRGLHDLAISECLRAIATDALYIEAHILMGLIYAQEEGQTARIKAIEAFQKAIYIDLASASAHFHLGELYRNISEESRQRGRDDRGSRTAALREYANAKLCLAKLPPGAEVDGLPAATLLRVCELNISALRV